MTLGKRREGLSPDKGKIGPTHHPHMQQASRSCRGADVKRTLSPCPEVAITGNFKALIPHWNPQVLYLWAGVLLLLHGYK